MPAGSAETAFTSPAPGCSNTSLVKSESKKQWEDNPEEKVRKKILNSKSKFHMGRQLQLKHLPRNITEDEIKELLCEFKVETVQLMKNTTGASEARAILEDPAILDDWNRIRSRMSLLRGQYVLMVTPRPTEFLLCVTRLPLDYTEEQFTTLVSAYGKVRRNFLMISEKTGKSKGYGFVDYETRECTLQAKFMLDKKQIGAWTLLCSMLDFSIVKFESLHSKCLYVDCLPKDFLYMGEFRGIFCQIANPSYCQIAIKNGAPQDWGLVEFDNWEHAELAQSKLNGYVLGGQPIRISYCIPGVNASSLHLKLLNDPEPKFKTEGLFSDPERQDLMKNQTAHFMKSTQDIILGNIGASKTGKVTHSKNTINIPVSSSQGKQLGGSTLVQFPNPPPFPGTPVTSAQGIQSVGSMFSQPPPLPGALPPMTHPMAANYQQFLQDVSAGQASPFPFAVNPLPPIDAGWEVPPTAIPSSSMIQPSSIPMLHPNQLMFPPPTSSTIPTLQSNQPMLPNSWTSPTPSTSSAIPMLQPNQPMLPNAWNSPTPLTSINIAKVQSNQPMLPNAWNSPTSSTRSAIPMAQSNQPMLPATLTTPTNISDFYHGTHSTNSPIPMLQPMLPSALTSTPPPTPPTSSPIPMVPPTFPLGLASSPHTTPQISSPIPKIQPKFSPAWVPPPTPPTPFLTPSPPLHLFSPPYGSPGGFWAMQPSPTHITTAAPTYAGTTPIGQKRGSIPELEFTPAGNYAGQQHFQGISFQYTNSFKRKKNY